MLDGFPRTLVQAQALDAALAREGKAIDIAINITAPDDVLIDRMLGRAKDSGRADDTPEAIADAARSAEAAGGAAGALSRAPAS